MTSEIASSTLILAFVEFRTLLKIDSYISSWYINREFNSLPSGKGPEICYKGYSEVWWYCHNIKNGRSLKI